MLEAQWIFIPLMRLYSRLPSPLLVAEVAVGQTQPCEKIHSWGQLVLFGDPPFVLPNFSSVATFSA